MAKGKLLEKTSEALILLGGVNWGLAGVGGFIGEELNVVTGLVNMVGLGAGTINGVYVAIGVAATLKVWKMLKIGKKISKVVG